MLQRGTAASASTAAAAAVVTLGWAELGSVATQRSNGAATGFDDVENIGRSEDEAATKESCPCHRLASSLVDNSATLYILFVSHRQPAFPFAQCSARHWASC